MREGILVSYVDWMGKSIRIQPGCVIASWVVKERM